MTFKALRTDKLYLIEIEYHTVAIIAAKDPLEAINKYLERIGFDKIHTYFCSCLMTNTIESETRTNHPDKCYSIAASTKTIGNKILSISSGQIKSCDDIFFWIDPKDIINNPLLVRPTTKEVRNCSGFSREPMHKLRKFCI